MQRPLLVFYVCYADFRSKTNVHMLEKYKNTPNDEQPRAVPMVFLKESGVGHFDSVFTQFLPDDVLGAVC